MKVLNLMMIILFHSALLAQEKSFYEDHARGWHWYEKNDEGDNSKQNTKDSQKTEKYPATKELKEYQAMLEEAKAAAVMHPTSKNIFNYQQLQYAMLEKAGKFANIWMQNVYMNPSIDYSLKSPSSQGARHIYLEEQIKHTEAKIRKLSKEYGLFFFFKEGCPYCDAFGPVVKKFSEKYEWEVLAISEFGEKHQLFKRSVQDNGLADIWGVSTYPSLFAVNPKTGHVIPVARGMISIQEMEERIIAIVDDAEDRETKDA